MKCKLLIYVLLISLSSISFSSDKDAATSVLNFFSSNFTENFEIRSLKEIPKSDKIILKKDNKTYSFYKGMFYGGANKVIETKLYKGFDYVFIASGDSKIEDLDIYIYDRNDNIVAIDRNQRKEAFPVLTREISKTNGINCDISSLGKLVSVRPKESGVYTIKIKNRSEEGTKGSWAMFIANKKSN